MLELSNIKHVMCQCFTSNRIADKNIFSRAKGHALRKAEHIAKTSNCCHDSHLIFDLFYI